MSWIYTRHDWTQAATFIFGMGSVQPAHSTTRLGRWMGWSSMALYQSSHLSWASIEKRTGNDSECLHSFSFFNLSHNVVKYTKLVVCMLSATATLLYWPSRYSYICDEIADILEENQQKTMRVGVFLWICYALLFMMFKIYKKNRN